MIRCTNCNSDNTTQSRIQGKDLLTRCLLPITPYRCMDCWTRFWKFGGFRKKKIYWLIVLLLFFIFLAPNLFLKSLNHKNLDTVKSYPTTHNVDVNNVIPTFSDTKKLKENAAAPASSLIQPAESGKKFTMSENHLSEVVPSQPLQAKKNADVKNNDEYIKDPILHAPENAAVEKSPFEKPLPEVDIQTDNLIGNPASASPPLASKTIKTLIVNVMAGRVREFPSLQSKIKYILKKGAQVSVLKIDQDWYLISFNEDNKGWAHKSLFAEKENL